jgi:hypothetical protein
VDGEAATRDAVAPMFMLTLHLMQPLRKAPIRPDTIRTMITDRVVPEDRIEHVYVQAGPGGQVDVIVFVATADLVPALVNGTALTSRLLQEPLSGWLLLKVCVENAARRHPEPFPS